MHCATMLPGQNAIPLFFLFTFNSVRTIRSNICNTSQCRAA